jgi:hypothetical protein
VTSAVRGRATWRSRLGCAGLIALLTLGGGGCKGPKIPAGNLKELNEKKRELKEAQRRAEQGATQTPDSAGATPGGGETATTPPASPAPADADAATTPPASASSSPVEEAPLTAGSARVTLRTADGGTRQLVLRQPLIGRWERTFLSGGGVRDSNRLASEFAFRDGMGRSTVKLKKIARVEWLATEGETRTGVRLRFHFRRADQPSEEFAGEDLLGAEHPVVPFLLGIDARGVEVRLPLYPPLDRGEYEPIVEVEFGGPA